MHRRALACFLLASGLAQGAAARGEVAGQAVTGGLVLGDGSDPGWPARFLVRTEQLCRPR